MNTRLLNNTAALTSWSLKLLFTACLAIGYSSMASATVIPIDLSGFYIYGTNLSVSSDGTTASFAEDATGIQQLSDDPGYGDPNVVTAASGTYLQFDYAFNMPTSTGNADIFHAGITDSFGNILDPSYQTYLYSSGTGTIQYDLSSLSGSTLGLVFELTHNIGDTDYFASTLTISNLQLVTKDVVANVSESGTGLLLLAGLLGLGLNHRKFRKAMTA